MLINECTKPEKKVSPEDYNDEYGPVRWRPGAEYDHGMHIGSELRDNPESRRTVAYTVQWILRGIAGRIVAWDAPKMEKELASLNVLRQAKLTIEQEIAENVEAARVAGCSWSQIGAGLGITKQAAQQKYGSK